MLIVFLAPHSKPWWPTLGYHSFVFLDLCALWWDQQEKFLALWFLPFHHRSAKSFKSQVGTWSDEVFPNWDQKRDPEKAFLVLFYTVTRRTQQQNWEGRVTCLCGINQAGSSPFPYLPTPSLPTLSATVLEAEGEDNAGDHSLTLDMNFVTDLHES